MRELDTAQHEAAHLVVGVALGLRLRRAVIEAPPARGWTAPGYCWFYDETGKIQAEALMFAAGIAWERALGHGDATDASEDEKACRALLATDHDLRACVRAAGAMLATLAPIHTRVTRALLARDLSSRDLARIARGERLDREE
jgi:hypothetical protein